MQTIKIVEGPHLLFVGANGHKTYGITVEHLGRREDVEARGFSRQYPINDYSLTTHSEAYREQLGLTVEQFNAILAELPPRPKAEPVKST